MLESVGDDGGAITSAGSGVVLLTSMILIDDEASEKDAPSKEELGITRCTSSKREIFF